MVQINFAQKEIQCKIVYYGPGMSGKTTNLELVHGKVPSDSRGELTSIATTGERTLYFDYMPLDLGQIAGIRTKFQLYTVPGQIYYKSTRRLVLQGVDGIVFVADSSAAKMQENKESWADLEENLKEMGKTVKDVPVVIQYNKRDLPDAMSIEELEKELNPMKLGHFEAVATRGDGVFPTLKFLAGQVLEAVNQGGLAKTGPSAAPSRAPAAAPAPVPGAVREPAMAAAASSSATHAPQATMSVPAGEFAASDAPSEVGFAPTPPPPDLGSGPPVVAAAQGTDSAPAAQPRSFEDRMVNVQGLGTSRKTANPVVVGLLVLIAGAILYAVSSLL